MATDKIEALRRTALFGELEEPELRALAASAVEHKLARDQILFVAGDEARGAGNDAGITVELMLTNQQIAARLGSVREVISRGLQPAPTKRPDPCERPSGDHF